MIRYKHIQTKTGDDLSHFAGGKVFPTGTWKSMGLMTGYHFDQWEFHDPKMEVLYHISGHILWGYSRNHRPDIGLIYGMYLQSSSVPFVMDIDLTENTTSFEGFRPVKPWRFCPV